MSRQNFDDDVELFKKSLLWTPFICQGLHNLTQSVTRLSGEKGQVRFSVELVAASPAMLKLTDTQGMVGKREGSCACLRSDPAVGHERVLAVILKKPRGYSRGLPRVILQSSRVHAGGISGNLLQFHLQPNQKPSQVQILLLAAQRANAGS